MIIWARVPWTEAGQILDLLKTDAAEKKEAAGISPKSYFDSLVAADSLDRAIAYLGIALPRQEAVRWATETLRSTDPLVDDPTRAGLLDGVELWLQNPTENQRRALWQKANEKESSPEQLLACAVFFSGGSIAPEDGAPVLPAQDICGRLAATAIVARAYERSAAEPLLRTAIGIGDRIAATGL